MDNFDQVLELLVKRISEELAKKMNSSEFSKDLSTYDNSKSKFITNAVNDLVNYYKKSEVYTKNETDGLLSALHSISMKVVETLPETDQQSNVIYLVPAKGPNAENAKDEFIWLENKWELIGTTRIATTQVHKADKGDFTTPDATVIENYFKTTGKDAGKAAGDVFVITTTVEGVVYGKSAYMLNKDGVTWEALDGQVDAENVIMRTDIKLAGNYTQVGNVTKGATETKTLATKGKSFKAVMDEIFTKKVQPTITAQPAVSKFALTGAGNVEAGTKVTSAQFGTAVLSAGSYTFGPATGITATAWKVDRVATPAKYNAKVVDAASGADDNATKGWIIGDVGDESENVVSSLAYKATATHGAGPVAKDNLGGESNPQIKIEAGEKSQTTSAYTSHRKYFYGSRKEKDALDSAKVRALTASSGAYAAKDLVINVAKGQAQVVIACIASAKGVTKVINNSSLNADVTAVFQKQTVQVAGVNGYKPVDYNVWVWTPAKPFEVENTKLTVTLG